MALTSDPLIGQHCSISDCNQLDFLPFVCIWCRNVFCLEHRSPVAHSCSNFCSKKDVVVPDAAVTDGSALECSFAGCKNEQFNTIMPTVTCEMCHKQYCLKHRLGVDHACKEGGRVEKDNSSLTVQQMQLLRQVQNSCAATNIKTGLSGSAKPAGRTQRSSKMASKVAVMRLKQQATNIDKKYATIPEEERVYLKVGLPSAPPGDGGEESCARDVAVCVSRKWPVGRVIDHVASLGGVRNDNLIANSKKLRLFFTYSGAMLPTDVTVDCLMSNSEGGGSCLDDGEHLLLVYV